MRRLRPRVIDVAKRDTQFYFLSFVEDQSTFSNPGGLELFVAFDFFTQLSFFFPLVGDS